MTTPWFIATEKFDKTSAGWDKYVAWSGLVELSEVVSLDSMLCPTVLPEMKAEYWSRVVNEDFMTHFFTDEAFLRRETATIHRRNLLCVFRNPLDHPSSNVPKNFEFMGYDLVETDGGVSALTNCGGFPDVFSNSELSEVGLLKSQGRAREVQANLRTRHPEDPHSHCHLWAIFRDDCPIQ